MAEKKAWNFKVQNRTIEIFCREKIRLRWVAWTEEGQELYELLDTTYNVRNKHEKLEGKDKACFDTPFMIPIHAESIYHLAQ